MTTHLDDDRLDVALRDLDAADRDLTAEQTSRKDALLASLLAGERDRRPATTGTTLPTPVPHSVPTTLTRSQAAHVVGRRRARRSTVRWAIPAAAAAALVGVMTVWGGPGGNAPAYASWTAGPMPVDGADLATAESACRENVAEALGRTGEDPTTRPTATPESFRTVASERRGDFLFLAMASSDGSTTTCFYDAAKPSEVRGSSAGLSTQGSPPPTSLAPNEIESNGGGMSSGPEGTYSFAEGRVGAEVAAVTVKSEGREVRATVADGWFVAWWPSAETAPNAPSPVVTYDVTSRDGTVERDVPDPLTARTELGPREIGDIASGGGVSEGGGSVVTVSGSAGADVASVTVRDGDRAVTAQVTDGTFLAEWPGDSDTTPELTYDVTLEDGTTLRDQKPVVENG